MKMKYGKKDKDSGRSEYRQVSRFPGSSGKKSKGGGDGGYKQTTKFGGK